MPITDYSQGVNAQLQGALQVAMQELIISTDAGGVSAIVNAINELRERMFLAHLAGPMVVRNIWDIVRSNSSHLGDLLSITTTFTMELSDVDAAVNYLAERLVPYTTQSLLVDKEVLQKTVTNKELHDLLSNNHWLLFLVVGSLNLRLVLEIAATVVPRK